MTGVVAIDPRECLWDKSVIVRPRLWKDAGEVLSTLSNMGVGVSAGAAYAIQKVTYPRKMLEDDIRLVSVSNRRLGFTEPTPKQESEEMAFLQGLYPCLETYVFDLCSVIVGQSLQKTWGTCLMMMEPIETLDYSTDIERYQSIFGIEITEGQLKLRSHTGFPDRIKGPDRFWVYCSQKPPGFSPIMFQYPSLKPFDE